MTKYAVFQQGLPTPDGRAVLHWVSELRAPSAEAAIAEAKTHLVFLIAKKAGKDLGGFPVVEAIR